jgi:hypothetical protein
LRRAEHLITTGQIAPAEALTRGALATFEAAGDDRGAAIASGQIADILFSRGDLDEALRIRKEEQLPVYERLGDVRERAVTMGKIADILESRGDLDEALRIRLRLIGSIIGRPPRSLSWLESQAPDILDGENVELKRRAGHFYSGLLLASPFAPAHSPVMLSGSLCHGEIGVRSQDNYEPAIPSMVRQYPPVTLSDLQLAVKLAEQIAALEVAPLNGGHWRLFRVFHLYLEARAIRDNMDRLHQYCRCIDGLIVSRQGEAKAQFKSRTELFIGARHHTLMGDTYAVRSDVEHLHENKHLEVFDRNARLDLVKKDRRCLHGGLRGHHLRAQPVLESQRRGQYLGGAEGVVCRVGGRWLARAGGLSQMPASIWIFHTYQYGRGIVARIYSPLMVREHSLAPIRRICGARV